MRFMCLAQRQELNPPGEVGIQDRSVLHDPQGDAPDKQGNDGNDTKR